MRLAELARERVRKIVIGFRVLGTWPSLDSTGARREQAGPVVWELTPGRRRDNNFRGWIERDPRSTGH